MIKLQKSFLILLFSATIAFGEPTVHQIYDTMQSGHVDEAHKMIEEVLKTHPDSAKAHFVDAEILARLGNKNAARDELAIAEQLSPKLPFVKPETVTALKQNLAGNVVENTSNSHESKSSRFPWMMLLLVVGVVFFIILIWRSLFGRRENAYTNAPAYNNNGGINPQQGYGNSGYNQGGGGLGSNIMGGLATGAAAGVGMVAAEELMHHFMDNNDVSSNNSSMSNNDFQSSNSAVDNDFGISDGSSWDDNSSSGDDDSSW